MTGIAFRLRGKRLNVDSAEEALSTEYAEQLATLRLCIAFLA
jgi:hypothetical protein